MEYFNRDIINFIIIIIIIIIIIVVVVVFTMCSSL